MKDFENAVLLHETDVYEINEIIRVGRCHYPLGIYFQKKNCFE